MRRTYLDTGVLIEAAAGKGPKAEVALAVLRDSPRVFLETYLSGTDRTEKLAAAFNLAFREATSSPVSGMDALHVAAAHLLGADEFITTEKPGKAIYRNSLVPGVFLSA